jgi:PadR family transcriptional regulator PadR
VEKSADLLPGTLDMLILKAVSLKPLHGYGVLLRIRQISGNALEVPQGSLYPALYRLNIRDLSRPSGARARTTGGRSTTR